MMNKKRSSKMGRAKYLVFLPLAALLLQFCNIDSAKKESLTDNIAEEKPVAEAIISESTTKHEGQVFTVVEEMPKFPGGEQELLKFINDNIKYPKIAQENGIQGRVIASFVVNKDGSVTDYEVVRGVDPVLDAEALRVISIFPEWTPGKQRGETVRVKYTVPITFRLGGGNDGSSEEIVVQAAETKPTQGKHGLIYTVVEEMPRFPGGDQKLLKFINEGIIYPKEAQEKGIQGRVICSFIVLKDGSVADVETVRGIDPLLDAEAVRVITKMPKWLPGKQGGNAVNVKYTVPITFRLQ